MKERVSALGLQHGRCQQGERLISGNAHRSGRHDFAAHFMPVFSSRQWHTSLDSIAQPGFDKSHHVQFNRSRRVDRFHDDTMQPDPGNNIDSRGGYPPRGGQAVHSIGFNPKDGHPLLYGFAEPTHLLAAGCAGTIIFMRDTQKFNGLDRLFN